MSIHTSQNYANNMPNYDTNNYMSTNYRSHIKIGSLNCRGLSKLSNPTNSAAFIRFLKDKELKYDILCFQETHAEDTVLERRHLQFNNNKNSLWTRHCGIVSLNPQITLHQLNIHLEERIIACQAVHCNSLFSPITLINLYAPAVASERAPFFTTLLTLPMFQSSNLNFDEAHSQEYANTSVDFPPSSEVPISHIPHSHQPIIILGDFNYHAHSYTIDNTDYSSESFAPPIQLDHNPPASHVNSQRIWHQLLTDHLIECTHSRLDGPFMPTFKRGTSMSTIDYLFCSPSLIQQLQSSSIDFMCSEWTDHAMLTATFAFSSSQQGPGLWRANPQLAKNDYFITSTHTALDAFFQQSPTTSPQMQWDAIKTIVKSVARRIGIRQSSWRHRQLQRLQRKRNRLLRQYRNQPDILQLRLPIIEKLIGDLQQEKTTNQEIRAGKHWREKGEVSAGYLKRTIATRAIKRNMLQLKHPITNTLCNRPDDMQDAASSFYQFFYSTEPTDQASIDSLLNTISTADQILPAHHPTLQQAFSIDDICNGAKRSPRHSSPGTDGLPYEILSVMLNHSRTARLAKQVFHEALSLGIFPHSWLFTCMCLLPKKGDLSDLRNYRPISLINCDAKIFTRLLNHRLMLHMKSRISPQQLGFMPDRFIGEHGFNLQLTKLLATTTNSSTIALLLDQEKAYDRIHPNYLQQVMLQFGIPQMITQSIISLFFSTHIQVNINGHLTTAPIPQERGLRQGDPLSPLLFNIAFDPFIRSIQQHPGFVGFHTPQETPPHPTPSDEINDLADSLASLLHMDSTTSTNLTDNDTIHNPPLPPPPTPPQPLAANTNIHYKILAYADDTLVYLNTRQDFQLLQQAITTYMQASNALLNYNKTIAISLSGKPQPIWQQFLANNQITTWHDRTDPNPITYLGYPICSSITQRNNAYQQLITKIRLSAFTHSQRNLSIRGRATVLNTLIFSRLWHVMRNFIFTQQQLQSFRSVGSNFINTRIFPKLSFCTLQQPRHLGGLKILDPILQQQALQWRWACPLLLAACNSHLFTRYTTSNLPLLQHALQWFYSSTTFPDSTYYLIFPTSRQAVWFPHRPPIQQAFLNPINSIIQTVNTIPRSFSSCHIDPVTCLTLPFLEIILYYLPSTHPHFHSFIAPDQLFARHPGVQKLLVADIFTFDFDNQVIRVRNWAAGEFARYPRISRKMANWIVSHQIFLQPFFLAQCCITPRHNYTIQSFTSTSPTLKSFCHQLLRPPSNNNNRPSTTPFNSIKYYKQLVSAPPTNTTTTTTTQWRLFWNLPIPLQSRTVWYRLIHNKIPTKAILNRLIPATHLTPYCTVCSATVIEDITHFFFTCPTKFSVWRSITHSYLSSSHLSDSDIVSLLLSISSLNAADHNRSPDHPHPNLSTSQVFAVTLLCIWQAHWRFIFDLIPIAPVNVKMLVTRSLARFAYEFQPDL